MDWVRKVRQNLAIPLTVGGGVASVDTASALLEAGADKVGINTAAVKTPELLTHMAAQFGSQCTVIAIDAAREPDGKWEVVTLSGKNRTGINAVEWAVQAEDRGAGEILLTSWDRDGTKSGYDLELLRAISQAVNVPIIASGGAANPMHMVEAVRAGADAVLAASIFHYGEYTVGRLKQELKENGIEVRI